MTDVREFRGNYFFLSNFSPAMVSYAGIMFPTVEHAYQCAKTIDPEERKRYLREITEDPAVAKRLGRRLTLRSDWDQIKDDVMLGLLRKKFSQPTFRDALLSTGDSRLYEGNSWRDYYWGVDIVTGDGLNRLGELLMQVREELNASVG